MSKLPHYKIVNIITNASDRIRLTVAERNYEMDSSDDDMELFNQAVGGLNLQQNAFCPKSKQSHFESNCCRSSGYDKKTIDLEGVGPSEQHGQQKINVMFANHVNLKESVIIDNALVFRVIVGYLGTIEMQKQICKSSKGQTVKDCIRKMRQEKCVPTIVQMQILPSSLSLINAQSVVLANYPLARLTYIGSNHESEDKYFGLLTSTIYNEGLICDNEEVTTPSSNVSISSSCHVFMIDPRITDHVIHFEKAIQFGINCTKDEITGLCLEFPATANYVVDLLKSMYFHKRTYSKPPLSDEVRTRDRQGARNKSPTLSNHSEMTTTSSNSDSGIGFHNDFSKIADKIVLVNFPHHNKSINKHQPNVDLNSTRPTPYASMTNDLTVHKSGRRLTFDAMPCFDSQPFKTTVPHSLLEYTQANIGHCRSSMSDISEKSNKYLKGKKNGFSKSTTQIKETGNDDFIFVKPFDKVKRVTTKKKKCCNGENTISHKLSPKVFGSSKLLSQSVETLDSVKKKKKKPRNNIASEDDLSSWSSLRELTADDLPKKLPNRLLDNITSAPELRENKVRDHQYFSLSYFALFIQVVCLSMFNFIHAFHSTPLHDTVKRNLRYV